MTTTTLPAKRNVTLYEGDTHAFTLTFTDADDEPIDVTARTFRAQVRAERGDTGDPLASWTVSQPAAHQVTFTLPAASTAALAEDGVTSAVWDVEMTNGTAVTTFLTGAVAVRRGVSQA